MSDLEARLTRTPVTRRRFLQGTGLVGVAAFLAACVGGGGASESAPGSTGPVESPTAPPTPTPAPATPKAITGPLKWANWTAYIDLAGKAGEAGQYAPGSSPTLEAFKKKYTVDVDYQEKIDANPSFIATIQPALNNGLATGWDLIVLTDSFAAQLIQKGWIEAIDHANTPNCVKNLRAPLKGVSWDPENNYHFPWQSGMTGVGYSAKAMTDAKLAAPTKVADLWTIPSNKVTFLEEARDTFGLTLLKLGIDPNPDTVTTDDLQKVHDDIQPLVDAGLRFTGNSYLQDFGQKKVWAAMVWSGDLASSGEPDDKFVFPEEGTMIWTDNMLIPKGAANKYTAELMMDFVYDPQIAAQIADYVFYVSPVEGAADVMKQLDPAALSNPLVFPPADVIAKQKNFQFLKPEIEQKMNDLFGQLSGA
ncbi:MAG: extracellular solute-binding protein [Candidatus Limnocylindrales bacterium]